LAHHCARQDSRDYIKSFQLSSETKLKFEENEGVLEIGKID
jgi:hypothetical protein